MWARFGGRTRRLCSALVVTALTVAGAAAVAGAPPVGAATSTHARPAASAISPDEPTASQNNLRDGWDQNEPTLTQSAVSGGKFGQIFKTGVNGQVYAQPLIIGNMLVVATENDWIYGINATTGAIVWKTSLGTPYNITSCKDLTPNIGVTSTPVYDPKTGSVYVMAMVKEANFAFHLFGLNVNTGAITLKQKISGSPTNDKHISFQAIPQDQRPGLLLMDNGWVYAAFASHCDHPPYAGYVAGVNVEGSRPVKTTLWTDEAGISDDKGGIWQSDGGLMSDGSGRIFFTSGNGISPGMGSGDSPPGQLAESIVLLQPQSDGSLQAKQFFSPTDAPLLDKNDKDFGSGGPVGLPFGTGTYPNIMFQAGKKGYQYLLDRTNLTGRHNHDHDLWQTSGQAGLWGHPGVFADTAKLTSGNAAGSNDYIYLVGQNDYFRAWKAGVNGSDQPTLNDQANSSFRFGYGSGSPVVTSNGTDANSAIVWVVDSPDSNGDGLHSALIGFYATPQHKAGGGTKMREIWGGNIGTSSKFTMAATGNGMVYVGTRDGNVYGFGILGAAALKSSGTATFADTAVNSASTAAATVTATRTVTVTGASIDGPTQPEPFTISRVTVTRNGVTAAVKFPVTLHKGDVLRAQVKFAPGTFGGATGVISFATSGGSGAISVPLVGDGTQTGLFATSTSLSFVIVEHDGSVVTNVPVGSNTSENTTLVNGGDTPVRVTSVQAPTGRYSAVGMPKVGTVIKPGEALPVQLTFTPTAAGTATGSFTITTNMGPAVTVTLSGIGLRPLTRFAAVPAQVNFGSIPVGHSSRKWVNITNTGNQGASTFAAATTQGSPFRAQYSIPKDLTVNGTERLTIPIIFTPTKAGPFHGLYKVTWKDGQGTHTLEVPISGTGVG
jgi:hypothetical protein